MMTCKRCKTGWDLHWEFINKGYEWLEARDNGKPCKRKAQAVEKALEALRDHMRDCPDCKDESCAAS